MDSPYWVDFIRRGSPYVKSLTSFSSLIQGQHDILTQHAEDVVPVIRDSEVGGNTAYILAVSKVHPHDGLHHGDVEEEEHEDWQEEEEEKRQLMNWIPL